ncbi:8-amino-7-oxononanoate synthase [Methylomonas paludis]|uniref:8-amino-7-oxononanoate synthase n=1 Tax=Methylomonas paludis TaxID=1173101 RepID=A0A975MMA5_9GAMM|nr:8-amino-7-oxononanoate synthase [Methylomonas paludis]QWF70422.1 8-amino-7-oxononanoate synthase [Methylomonas paludis]
MAKDFYDFSAELAALKQQHLYRQRQIVTGPQDVVLNSCVGPVINFCSNDYLGLANHPGVAAAFKAGVDRYGVGSGAAHLICGHTQAHHALEAELAAFTGRDRALLFSTGYMANLGVISALLGRHDVMLADRLNHASLLDGARLSGAKLKRYRHGSLEDIQQQLGLCQTKALIVSDGVFSMDGDLAPLLELATLAAANRAGLLIDDAHGLGVLGKTGGGCVEHFGFSQAQVPILMGTLGKAFGCFGAFIAGSEDLIELLIQKARTYIYTTALPAAVAEAARASLDLVQTESWRRQRLQELIMRFRAGADSRGWQLADSQTAIQPVIIGDSEQAMIISRRLLEQGIWVSAIRPPTVPAGTARLRITFTANHTDKHVDTLLAALAKVLP